MPLVGNVEARIWRNDGKSGPYHTVGLFRFYSSGNGQKEAGSFRYQDLTHAMLALARAKKWKAARSGAGGGSERSSTAATPRGGCGRLLRGAAAE